MSGKDRPIDPEVQRKAENQFLRSTRMHADAINIWSSLSPLLRVKKFNELWTLPTYEVYFRGKDDQAVADHIMSISDPDRVAEFDRLVEKWNRELPVIQQNRDPLTAYTFIAEAERILKGSTQSWLLEKIESLRQKP